MARGRPALWSFVIGTPFIYIGWHVHSSGELPALLGSIGLSHPEFYGTPSLIFGTFTVFVGIYVQFITPPEPTLRKGEEIIEKRYPTQRLARAHIITSVPFLLLTVYLLEFTTLPYVYPIIAFVIGLYYMSIGMYTYWRNTLTTYYITTNRVISIYQFLSLSQKEIPLEKIRGVEERKSVFESLLNIGSIRIASAGGGGTVTVTINNIDDPSGFANEMRRWV